MIKILDTTLREGEQASGVDFTLKQKVEIAGLLDKFGVDYIEAGMPAISQRDKEKVKAVVDLNLKAEIVGFARAKREDIDGVKETGAQWVGIFCGINERYRAVNLDGKSFGETCHMIHDALCYAKDKGLKVKYAIEDASRTENSLIRELIYQITSDGRADELIDRLCFADTAGVCLNSGDLMHSNDYSYRWDQEYHFHNDLGMTLKNSLDIGRVYRLMADDTRRKNLVISCSVNGIGERAGITSLAEFCFLYSYTFSGNKKVWGLRLLNELSEKVAEYSGIQPDPLRPIIGRNAFTHTAKLHRRAVKVNPHCYEPFDPSLVGRNR